MSREENIKQNLISKFPYLRNSLKITRLRRLSAEVDYNNFSEIFDYAVKQLQFSHLSAITGLDEGENLSAIYHLAQDSGILLNLKTSVPKQKPVIKTVMPYFPCAENYERELVDLLGFWVEGLPIGNHYPLTDDWPKGQFPLRKDWKQSQEQQEEVKDA